MVTNSPKFPQVGVVVSLFQTSRHLSALKWNSFFLRVKFGLKFPKFLVNGKQPLALLVNQPDSRIY